MGVLGRALTDFYEGRDEEPLMVFSDRASQEIMNKAQFFWEEPRMHPLDRFCLARVAGPALDVGAGAGRFSLALQKRGIEVQALEADPTCAALMVRQGVQVVHQALWQYFEPLTRYTTIFALMNGAGLAGTAAGLSHYVNTLASWLAPGGTLYLDSSSIAYLAKPKKPGQDRQEIIYRFSYGGEQSEPFGWLYAEKHVLLAAYKAAGLQTKVVYNEATGRFLVEGVNV